MKYGFVLPEGDSVVGATGASHAWGEGWIPGRGWCGFDPTNPVTVGDHHVKLAVGRDYRDVPPTKGSSTVPRPKRSRSTR